MTFNFEKSLGQLPSFFSLFFVVLLLSVSVAEAAVACAEEEVKVTSALQLVPEKDRLLVEKQLKLAKKNRGQLEAALTEAPKPQRPGLIFLLKNMPERDLVSLDKDFLLENLKYAYKTRTETPWGQTLDDELFFNYVLPYASINERRDNWRGDFYKRFIESAKKCKTASEAACKLNLEAFKELKVVYHATKRPKPDQSPFESTKAGYASCSGLSVIAIDAFRAVGIPARFVGTPLWTDKSGNHSWCEYWDGQWRFLGASETDKPDSGWFIAAASRAHTKKPEHWIYATSFEPTGLKFPLVWDLRIRYIHADNITRFYTARRPISFRILDAEGKKVATKLSLRMGKHLVAQGSGTGPINFVLAGDGQQYQMQIASNDGTELLNKKIAIEKDSPEVIEIRLPKKVQQK